MANGITTFLGILYVKCASKLYYNFVVTCKKKALALSCYKIISYFTLFFIITTITATRQEDNGWMDGLLLFL